MKIGMVSRFPPEKDGLAIYAGSLCKALSKLGCEIVKIGDLNSDSADYKIDLKSFKLKSELKRIIEKEKLDLLHVQYIAACYGRLTLNMNLFHALEQDIPVVVTMCEVHYDYEGYSIPRMAVLKLLERIITGRADYIITHTRQQKAFLQEKYGKKETDYAHIGLELKGKHRLKDKNVLFFGMLNWGKGVEYLIRAMQLLPGYKLTVAGRPYSSEYEQYLRKTAAENFGLVKLDFRWIPDEAKEAYFREADVVVYPYVWAPYQSAAVNDALSYGIPVVVTKAGSFWETINDYKCGAVVSTRVPREIAEGIKEVLANYEKYQKGIESYAKEADWEKIARKHIEIYKKALD